MQLVLALVVLLGGCGYDNSPASVVQQGADALLVDGAAAGDGALIGDHGLPSTDIAASPTDMPVNPSDMSTLATDMSVPRRDLGPPF